MMIIILTLATGAEVIGMHDEEESNENGFFIYYPMIITANDDSGQFYLSPWSFFSREQIFSKKMVLSLSNDPIPPICELWEKIVDRDMARLNAEEDEELPDGIISLDDNDLNNSSNVIPFNKNTSGKHTVH
jgi:hypothetical protein